MLGRQRAAERLALPCVCARLQTTCYSSLVRRAHINYILTLKPCLSQKINTRADELIKYSGSKRTHYVIMLRAAPQRYIFIYNKCTSIFFVLGEASRLISF